MLSFLFVCVCFAVAIPLMLMIGQLVIGVVIMLIVGIFTGIGAIFEALFGRRAS